jgi:hypothetical protein
VSEASAEKRRTNWRRIALGIGLWIAYAAAAHAVVHRYLFDVGPVPGPGLYTLGAQALAVSLGALVLLGLPRPPHLINPRAIVAVSVWVALIVFGHYLAHLDTPEIRATLVALRGSMGIPALIVCAFLLALMLGVPFVPSVEMGLLVMAVFGPMGAAAAWLATIAGLSMAFAAGRYMPTAWVRGWLERQGLFPEDAGGAEEAVAAMLEGSRLSSRIGGRIAGFLLRHRYLLFAVLINMPLNSVLGGGGGIALVCGFSRLYRWRWFLLTTALASLPIPLLVFIGFLRVDDILMALMG